MRLKIHFVFTNDFQALGSHSRFPPHLLLAVAALPLPILILAIPIKVLFPHISNRNIFNIVFYGTGVP